MSLRYAMEKRRHPATKDGVDASRISRCIPVVRDQATPDQADPFARGMGQKGKSFTKLRRGLAFTTGLVMLVSSALALASSVQVNGVLTRPFQIKVG